MQKHVYYSLLKRSIVSSENEKEQREPFTISLRFSMNLK